MEEMMLAESSTKTKVELVWFSERVSSVAIRSPPTSAIVDEPTAVSYVQLRVPVVDESAAPTPAKVSAMKPSMGGSIAFHLRRRMSRYSQASRFALEIRTIPHMSYSFFHWEK
jgi:hypothetical protein